jgi:arylsulfatase A-like enzyme
MIILKELLKNKIHNKMNLNLYTLNFRILAFLAIAVYLTGCAPGNQKKGEQPNIVFIMSDDHAYQAISTYGGPLASLAPTPNIDRIAEEGMRFDRCMVTNSICGPSRATILTGKYSHINGFRDNANNNFDGSQLTFPKVLQKAGYQTAMIGKWHLGTEPTGFDYWDILPGQGSYYNPVFIDSTGEYDMDGYATEIIAEKTVQWLSKVKDSGKPFMVMMHHKAPHRNWQPGPNELGMYEDVTFPEPATLFDDYSGRGEAERNNRMTIATTMSLDRDLKISPEGTVVPNANPMFGGNALDSMQLAKWKAVYDPVNEEFKKLNLTGDDLVRYKYQRYMKDYLSCIAAVDKSVGKVLDYLKENGLDENTIVVYTSDQGFYLGEHGWFDKRWMFRESLRTPLIIKWPGVIEAGSANKDLVSNLDFGETFIDIAGSEIPEEMQGESFLPILKGETPPDWRQAFYYHYYEHPGEHWVPRHYGITTDLYKLIHFYYDIDDWELFDLEKDPNEMKDVYDDPAYKNVRDSLHMELEKLRDLYHDSDELAQKFIREDIENPRFLMMMQWMLRMDPTIPVPAEIKARVDTMQFDPMWFMPGSEEEEE